MSKKRDYYQILGVTKQATEAEIKKAYKKMAIKYHPDKNPDNKDQAVQRFREISQAYQNLSNPQKRKIYDTYGFEGPKASTFSHFDFSDANNLFSKFFENHQFDDDPFFSSFFGKSKGQAGKGNGFFGNFGFGKSIFDDEDFLKGNSGFSSGFTSFNSGGFGGGGVSRSVSTTTKTVNGKTVVTRKTTLTKEDGTKQVTEEVTQNGKKTQNKYMIGPGESDNHTKGKLKY